MQRIYISAFFQKNILKQKLTNKLEGIKRQCIKMFWESATGNQHYS